MRIKLTLFIVPFPHSTPTIIANPLHLPENQTTHKKPDSILLIRAISILNFPTCRPY